MPIDLIQIRDVGLELETGSFTQSFVKENFEFPVGVRGLWRDTHDGSVQRMSSYINFGRYRMPVKMSDRLRPFFPADNFGSEIVSPILNTEEDNVLEHLRSLFAQMSVFDVSDPKCAFHVHVNMTQAPVYVLQNLIQIWLQVESLIYRLSVGELGYHRGIHKNMLFCRPLNSPQVTIYENTLRPCFSVEALLRARNIREFFKALGNTPTNSDPSKYNAVRYVGLNFHNFIRHGTVEFRTPNQTTDPHVALAWVHLFQAMCREAFGKGLTYSHMPLGTNPSNFDIGTLANMFETLTDQDMLVLEHLFNTSDWVPFDPNVYLFTHLEQEGARYINWSDVPEHLIPPVVDKPVVVYYNRDSDVMRVIRNYTDYLTVPFPKQNRVEADDGEFDGEQPHEMDDDDDDPEEA